MKEKKGINFRCIKKALGYVFKYSKCYLFVNTVMIITQGLLPATFIIIMQKIINSLQNDSCEFDEIMILLIIYNMPLYMMDDTVTDKKKVLMLNNYLKELEERKKPELIVLGVPGELYSPSLKYIAGCGFLAMDCFYATEPDALIVALPYKKYTQMDLMRIGEGIQRKFGIKVDAFVRTNKRLLGEETELQQKCTYLTVGKKDMEHIDYPDDYLFELKEVHIKAMMDIILSRLEEYGKIESI